MPNPALNRSCCTKINLTQKLEAFCAETSKVLVSENIGLEQTRILTFALCLWCRWHWYLSLASTFWSRIFARRRRNWAERLEHHAAGWKESCEVKVWLKLF